MSKNKTILLTGSTGMVGRNILENKNSSNFNFITPSSKELDLKNFSSTFDFIRKYRPDLIIHAAAKVGGIQSNLSEPSNYLIENIDISRNLILAAKDNQIESLINIGSSCMYPRNIDIPITEDMLLTGELEKTNEGYAIAKIFSARLCDYIRLESPFFQYKTIIPCNLYGRFDKFNPTKSHLVAAVIDKLHKAKISNNNQIEIWGNGMARREFMCAEDLADFLIRAINLFDTLPYYTNVGLGFDYTINEYYKIIADVVGYNGTFVHDESKPIGMNRKLVNVEKQTTWGWKPRIGLKEGIEKTYNYYLSEHINEF
jgi:GDP-L-fucose synthase